MTASPERSDAYGADGLLDRIARIERSLDNPLMSPVRRAGYREMLADMYERLDALTQPEDAT